MLRTITVITISIMQFIACKTPSGSQARDISAYGGNRDVPLFWAVEGSSSNIFLCKGVCNETPTFPSLKNMNKADVEKLVNDQRTSCTRSGVSFVETSAQDLKNIEPQVFSALELLKSKHQVMKFNQELTATMEQIFTKQNKLGAQLNRRKLPAGVEDPSELPAGVINPNEAEDVLNQFTEVCLQQEQPTKAAESPVTSVTTSYNADEDYRAKQQENYKRERERQQRDAAFEAAQREDRRYYDSKGNFNPRLGR
jgi:hypothetical protein